MVIQNWQPEGELTMTVSGKVVVMTGAAGQLGHVVAREFARAGVHLVLVDRGQDRLGQMFGDLPDALLIGATDVTDPASVGAMVERTIAERGRIDALINMAGGWRGGQPLHEVEPEAWDFVMNLNAKSVFTVCRAVIPHMIAQGSGKIVSVAAKSGLQGAANTSIYNASKAVVIRLTESMSAELKDNGINVNCVLPTIIDTPQNREQMPKGNPEKWVTPEQMAAVLMFLASDAADAIHGAAVPVYGRV
jgi:NAD(P)-dependent dehydrogenase (short-subunit alcohol dehydrogenase family)